MKTESEVGKTGYDAAWDVHAVCRQ